MAAQAAMGGQAARGGSRHPASRQPPAARRPSPVGEAPAAWRAFGDSCLLGSGCRIPQKLTARQVQGEHPVRGGGLLLYIAEGMLG